MKATQIFALFVSIFLFAVCGITDVGGKNILTAMVPVPADIKIIAPAKDVSEEIAAFSGAWKGKWHDYATEVVLVVEEINLEEAKIIYCLGESSELYKVPASCERYKAVVAHENQRIQFALGESQLFTFSMEKNLDQIKAIKKTPLDIIESIMTKIK